MVSLCERLLSLCIKRGGTDCVSALALARLSVGCTSASLPGCAIAWSLLVARALRRSRLFTVATHPCSGGATPCSGSASRSSVTAFPLSRTMAPGSARCSLCPGGSSSVRGWWTSVIAVTLRLLVTDSTTRRVNIHQHRHAATLAATRRQQQGEASSAHSLSTHMEPGTTPTDIQTTYILRMLSPLLRSLSLSCQLSLAIELLWPAHVIRRSLYSAALAF